MKPRHYPGVAVQASAVFTADGLTGEGRELDRAEPGCLFDSPLSPKIGDSLTLRLGLLQMGATIRVAREIVCWVQGSRFGGEFIELDPKKRLHYNATAGSFLRHQAASHSRPDHKGYSRQPGGVNWHLHEHGVSTTHHTVSSAVASCRTR